MATEEGIGTLETAVAAADMTDLVEYLKASLSVCLCVSANEVDAAVSRCADLEFDPCAAFCQNEQQQVLFVVKASDNGITFFPEVNYLNGRPSVLFFKQLRAPLSSDAPIASQVQLTVLSGCFAPTASSDPNEEARASTSDNTLENMYAILKLGFVPMLKSLASKSKAQVRQGFEIEDRTQFETDEVTGSSTNVVIPETVKQSLPIISKRMNELEYALRSCLQSMEIPEVQLLIDPLVQEALLKTQSSDDSNLSFDDLGLSEDVRNTTVLNRLQACVNRWVREIQTVAKLERDPSTGTVSQEVQFWHGLDRALQHIQRQVDGREVFLTLEILKQSQRNLPVALFQGDTGLQSGTKRVKSCMILMQDFPIAALLAATDVPQIKDAIKQIFSHLKKIKSAEEYPLKGAVHLMEALSHDLTTQLSKVLNAEQLALLPFPEFEQITRECISLFETWEYNIKQFRDHAKDLAKQRHLPKLPENSFIEYVELQNRVTSFASFRKSHETLRLVIEKIIVGEEQDTHKAPLSLRAVSEEEDKENSGAATSGSDAKPLKSGARVASSSLDEVDEAYAPFKLINTLDLSREGALEWENATKSYERRINRVESQIIERLSDKLGAAKSADEMFRVFSKFNALFYRERIRGAVQQFQTQLIATVEQDIEALQVTFKKSYGQSQASLMSKVRDVPPVSGAIIWARQIERQLDVYLKGVESVLGPSWEEHIDGRRLYETGNAFKRKLNTQKMFEQWLQNIQKVARFEVSGRLFNIEERGSDGKVLDVVVNFDPQIVQLFKEVRNLQWLGFEIPRTLKTISDDAKEKYPFAMSLQSALGAFKSTISVLDEERQSLLATSLRDVEALVESTFKQGKDEQWEGESLQDLTANFSRYVYQFQNKVEDASQKISAVNHELVQLKSCPYKSICFRDKLDTIQRFVDEMNLSSYSHLGKWVERLEQRIDALLLERLEGAIHDWMDDLNSVEAGQKIHKRRKHEIVLRKHALDLDPPLEEARLAWIRSLHQHVSVVCNLRRLQSSRYDAFGAENKWVVEEDATGGVFPEQLSLGEAGTFSDLLSKMAGSQDDLLTQAYALIETKLDGVHKYVQTWLQYQALWSIEATDVYKRVGEDLEAWQQLLVDIIKARTTFDTAEHAKQFGPVTVDYQQVQAQVSLRYDAWHKDILSKFLVVLGASMSNFLQKAMSMRQELEHGSFDAPTSEVVLFISALKRITTELPSLDSERKTLASGEHLAQRQRAALPPSWVWYSIIQGEWDALEQILKRKTKAMDAELATLQSKVLTEDRAVSERVAELGTDWASARPTKGDTGPDTALNLLVVYEGRVSHLEEEWAVVEDARVALNISSTTTGSETSETLEAVKNEVTSLKLVWTALGSVAKAVSDLKETPWTAVVPKKLRLALDEIIEQLRKLPPRIQQYEAFEFLQASVRSYKETQHIVTELRSEALKERHWRSIVKVLGLKMVPLSDLSLGDLWNRDLSKHQKPLQDVFRAAQGEMALEEFLRQVREFWSTHELDLVSYQNRCRIIRGWDELFTQLDEHTSSLQSMKQSPYFRVFEEEALTWDDKLTRIRVILDAWIEVQRRWIYLGGILLGSADIKQQLPNEHSRFMSIDNDFVTLMRKIGKVPRLTEVIATFPNLEHTLARLADLLDKIQRALGEYLEQQRQSFARFYFVGDEDLLEIIGNTKDPVKVQRHMSKMFAGISSLQFQGSEAIESIVSRENEVVPLSNRIELHNVKVGKWLQNVEIGMQETLLSCLKIAAETNPLAEATEGLLSTFSSWIDQFPAQILLLASQLVWSNGVNAALVSSNVEALREMEQQTGTWLSMLAGRVLEGNLSTENRKKHEQLITELVHQRDVLRKLGPQATMDSFAWLSQIRYSWGPEKKSLELEIANAQFDYGFEYQGVGERLVQTPLTDRCYLALTQALHFRQGGNPFGPAGTGKTESVKALGAQLGRFVLVFNCDEHFDLKAMGRIFVGLCQVGAWGCFDEFNRLEERILSAVSQQILAIQKGLLEKAQEISLIGKTVSLNPSVGVFVTMNPGYAGRSNLPDNLKQLFRSIAMIEPDRELIAQVMLFSQGFKSAEKLSGKVVLLFKLCSDQLSDQPHYDFGLRAVKSVLLSAGNLKRSRSGSPANENASETQEADVEREILVQSLCENVSPKLVSEDVPLYQTLLRGVFPDANLTFSESSVLREAIFNVCKQKHLVPGERWVSKVLQLNQVQELRHGVMMVGPSGGGKSSSWRVLLEALELLDGVKGQAHVIDPKALDKEALYGTLDPNTLEWTNGVFTHTLRTILNNIRGEKERRHWIVFDGDVDPEWAENLNSVLDDNKLLTLPNGERLSIPDNVRIMFEVESLKCATLATVSRCGMVWYSEDTLSLTEIFQHRVELLAMELDADTLASDSNGAMSRKMLNDTAIAGSGADEAETKDDETDSTYQVGKLYATLLVPLLQEGAMVHQLLEQSTAMKHVMDVTRMRLIVSLFSLFARGIAVANEYNSNHPEFELSADQLKRFFGKWTLFSLLWGLGGSMAGPERANLESLLLNFTTAELPESMTSLWDYEVNVADGEWRSWNLSVPKIEIEPHKVMDTDVVISTMDTVRHVEVLRAWLDEHRPLILCGPPGSGKTMSLTSVLTSMPNFELASLNFSSATTPELILKTFEQYCVYRPTRDGMVLAPSQPDRWLVVFCDEVNLPVNDAYGTQRVITFMRQIVEQKGFWRSKDLVWVKVERVQFVSACNPPTDPGRVPLSHRFLRHTPVLLVDYPGKESLSQIYGTFNRALLKLQPSLRAYGESLTNAMVEVYDNNKKQFSVDAAPHYVYSPRELSRWMRALFEAMGTMESTSLDQLVRLWLHEGMRLFHDRLVTQQERTWCLNDLESIAKKHFQGADHSTALNRPVLFANWLSKQYASVDQDSLRKHVEARLRVFNEEELNVPLVVFDDVLEHVLRIDRVLRQPLGHLLLVGKSGTGKTVLSKFVSWMNGYKIFQIKLSRKYSLENFDEDLRHVMKLAGCQGERVCFIFDESNILDSAFLERMNALLASGEVPGLFEGDEHHALMSAYREGAQKDGTSPLMDSNEEELFREFTRNVQRNLHVVFTMNPASSDLKNRAATSPALFNRCVVDWFGDWSKQALAQVGYEFTRALDLDSHAPRYEPPSIRAADLIDSHRKLAGPIASGDRLASLCDAVVSCLVSIHESVQNVVTAQEARHETHTFVSPRDYLDLIKHFVDLYHEKRTELEEQQLHLNVGLDKLKETAQQVEELGKRLTLKERELSEKNIEANKKLQQMISDQNEAVNKKEAAERLGEELDERNSHVDKQRQEAEAELSEAEPALVDAQKAVGDIRKAHLDEMRSLNNPPPAVKLTLEAVCLMLGFSFSGWGDIRKILQRRDFIPDVVNFKSENLSEEGRVAVQKMLENPDFVEEKVTHANKACGPLFKWILSQIQFAGILHRIRPLRDEIAKLADESGELMERHKQEMIRIEELEAQIATLKDEYAVLIGEIENIKVEMVSVKAKVERSTALLDSLSQENERWSDARVTFKDEMSTLVGDALLAAAFISYAGCFGFRERRAFTIEWSKLLDDFGVSHKRALSLVEHLCKPSDRLHWQAQGLPSDSLSIENAIILERFNRFPLVIDPSGHATDFLLKRLAEKKVVKTSFLDSAFIKQLESALRFGTCLVITDVENIDPILNPVLNREIHRTGGRMLVRLGDQLVDFSPSFSLYLTTRDPTFQFAPDVCSRVTFVNFTATPASLQAQCLGKLLRIERPEIEKQREDLLKLQGEYQVRLRELEENLLSSLNAAEGNILDNDSVVRNLENLKNEAREIICKAGEADQVMVKVEQVSEFYSLLAGMCSKVYFALKELSEIHSTYHFSLGFFFRIVEDVFSQATVNLPATADFSSRLEAIQRSFFLEVYSQTKHALLDQDQLLWAIVLSKVFLDGVGSEGLDTEALELLWRPAVSGVDGSILSEVPDEVLNNANYVALSAACKVPALGSALLSSIKEEKDAWLAWQSQDQSAEPPIPVPSSRSKINTQIYRLHLLSAFRRDLLLAGIGDLVCTIFEMNIFEESSQILDLGQEIRATEPRNPVLLLSTQGFDMSSKVDALASSQGVRCASVAMGSEEGYTEAERVIASASQNGGWVLLKNVHLAPSWLQSLEKMMFGLHSRADFRLVLTSEVSDKLPKTLLRQSRKLMFESPKGVRAGLLRSLQAMPEQRMNRAPVERSRLYFLLAWFHAVILERLRFAPIGWSKTYEFSDADQACAMDVIDEWVDRVARGREHIAPEEVPWQSIRSVILESTYGGRIDNQFDQEILENILGHVFVPDAFNPEFSLVIDSELKGPEGTCKAHFESWVRSLPAAHDPSWLGLAHSADKLLLKAEADRVISKYLLLKDLNVAESTAPMRPVENFQGSENVLGEQVEDNDDAETASFNGEEDEGAEDATTAKPQWLKTVNELVSSWSVQLSQVVDVSQLSREKLLRNDETVSNPIFRCLEREAAIVEVALRTIPVQLEGLALMATGQQRMTNELLNLAQSIARKEIPQQWQELLSFGSKSVTVEMWFSDIVAKLRAFGTVLRSENTFQLPLKSSLGCFFMPGAFLTATRQQVARSKGVSLESLMLVVEEGSSESEDGFQSRVVLEGGREVSREVISCFFAWEIQDPVLLKSSTRLPLYTDSSRVSVLTEVYFIGNVGPNSILRGVALIAHDSF